MQAPVPQPTTIIFNFANNTVTPVAGGPVGDQQKVNIAAQQDRLNLSSGRPS